jgi:chemosensory pili system protein ChpA (sensor histidine kinase/response regulator)
MTQDKYFKDFVTEATVMSHKLTGELEKIKSKDFGSDNTYEAYRLAHSLNSSSQMAGLPVLGQIASVMESSLESFVEDPETQWPEDLPDLLIRTNKIVSKILDQLNSDIAPDFDAELEAVEQIWSSLEQVDEIQKESELSAVVEDFFLMEAEEHLKTMTDGFLALEKNPTDKTTIDSVFRAAHTLKGAASSVGFKATEVASHALEDVLEQIREGELSLNSQKTDILLGSLDALKETLQLETKGDKSAGKVARQMVDIVGTIGVTVEKAPAKTQVFFPSEDRKITREPDVRVRLSKLDNLMNMTGEFLVQRSRLDESRIQFMSIADQMRLAIRRLSSLTTDLSQQRLLQRTDEAMRNRLGTKVNAGSRFASEFDELEFDRYGELDRIIRNQTEVHADMVEMLTRFEDEIDELGTNTSKLIQNVTSIQDSVISSRLISISQVLDRFPRMVRDLARNENKQVNLVIEGETVEIDVKIADRIYDPLLHIIRNAVHHGIESPKTRASLGKPEEGLIGLSAAYEGNQVVLRISNDGAPLDTENISRNALRLGLVTASELEEMQPAEINRFIFRSGLSTAEDTDMVAGRGVGLDVVKTIIEELGGIIDVMSDPDRTEFTIKLPISLVISQGLVVNCHETPYVIPLGQVSEVINIPASEIKEVGQTPVYQLREEFVPIHFIDEILDAGSSISKNNIVPSVLVEYGNSRILIGVSNIPGKHDMVIKALPKMFQGNDLFAGATIFGSGQVVLVLNPRNLVETKSEQQRTQARKPTAATAENGRKKIKKILVVDDSLSMRKILQLDLSDAGFEARTASSGLEALDFIEKEDFDLLVLDIEMPEMDGFELMSILRDDPRFQHIPNMIITSRAGQKHRSKAFELGANAYLVKPYDQQLFLETVTTLLQNGNGEDVV